MTQELGRIERPSAEDFRGKRKLLLVPQLYHPPTLEEDGAAILNAFWEQTRSQISSLEAGLGPVKHIYHESVVQGGEDGIRSLEAGETPSLALVREWHQAGATLEATEDAEGTMGDSGSPEVPNGAFQQRKGGHSAPRVVQRLRAQALRAHIRSY